MNSKAETHTHAYRIFDEIPVYTYEYVFTLICYRHFWLSSTDKTQPKKIYQSYKQKFTVSDNETHNPEDNATNVRKEKHFHIHKNTQAFAVYIFIEYALRFHFSMLFSYVFYIFFGLFFFFIALPFVDFDASQF